MAFQIINDASLSAIVQNVAGMVGFPVPQDPAGDGDPAVQQMVQAVNLAGNDLLSMNDWQELTKTYTINVQADFTGQEEKAFSLPEDYYKFIDQTQWDATTQFPALGPISPQMWQQLQIRNLDVTLSFYWQVRNRQIYILTPPDSAQTLSFFYQSLAWVVDQDDPTLYKNKMVNNGDTTILDAHLLTLFSRVKWLEMKGLDSSAAMRDFQVTFENRKGNDKGAQVLSMARDYRFPYIQPLTSTPDTGYGA